MPKTVLPATVRALAAVDVKAAAAELTVSVSEPPALPSVVFPLAVSCPLTVTSELAVKSALAVMGADAGEKVVTALMVRL